jgi:hypothetical protein
MVSTFIDAGVFAIVVMASLPLLMRRGLRRRRVIVVALIARRKAGVVALIVVHWHYCPHCAGLFALVLLALCS